MKYRGYEVSEKDNYLEISGIRDFNPVHTFECGQCFRWRREKDASYTGVVSNRLVNLRYEDGCVVIRNANIDDFTRLWFDYLDLGKDYGEIKEAISSDAIMREAVQFGAGIRLLKQEPWEVLISFIISTNNRIPRIMNIIEDISTVCGPELESGGVRFYGFPDAGQLTACGIEKIKSCRAGYRCDYIFATADKIDSGRFDLSELKGLTTEEARRRLIGLPGVGNKVADCVLLFGGIKSDVFPTDVWVKRGIEELYFKREAGFKEIQEFAAAKFGRYAGIAQQYLFYYIREGLRPAKNGKTMWQIPRKVQ